MIDSRTITVTTTGSAGSATGSATIPAVFGQVVAAGVNYTGQPATVDVTVTFVGEHGVETDILTITSANTDIPIQNLANDAIDNAGAAETALPVGPYVGGDIRIDVAQGDPAGTVAVSLLVDGPDF